MIYVISILKAAMLYAAVNNNLKCQCRSPSARRFQHNLIHCLRLHDCKRKKKNLHGFPLNECIVIVKTNQIQGNLQDVEA